MPSEWNELYITVSLGPGNHHGFAEFSPKKIFMTDNVIGLNSGRVSFGASGKRYNRTAFIYVSKTTVKIGEVLYSDGVDNATTDVVYTNDSIMNVWYR